MCYEIGFMFYVQLPIDNYAIAVIVCYFEIEFFFCRNDTAFTHALAYDT